jgi:hypothetical protein
MANEYHLVDDKAKVRFELGKWSHAWGLFGDNSKLPKSIVKGLQEMYPGFDPEKNILKLSLEEMYQWILEHIKPQYKIGTTDEWFQQLAEALYTFIQKYPDGRNIEEQEMWGIERRDHFKFKQIDTIYKD